MTRRLPRLAALLAAGALLLPLGCDGCGERRGGADPALATPVAAVGGGELQPVPLPDLSGAEPAVRRQVDERMAAVDRLREAGGETGGEPGADGTRAAGLAEAYGALAQTLMSYQLTEAADVALANAHRLDPDELRWAYLLGYLRELSGDPEGAGELMRRSLAIRPDYLPARVRLGDLELAAGDEPAARRHYRAALEQDDSVAAVHAGLGRAATARGEHGEAVERFRRALELQPDASSLHYLLGQALRRAGDVEAARRQLARAGDGPVQLPDPLLLEVTGLAESAQFYVIQGAEAAADERWEQAAAAFTRALEIDPGSAAAHRGLGVALQRLGDAAGAERELRAALEVLGHGDGDGRGAAGGREEAAQVSSLLADLLVAQGRDEEAVGLLQRGLAAYPEGEARTERRLVLADTYARLGRLEAALAEYDRIVAATGGDTAAARVRRATVLVNLGRGDEALAEFRRAVERSPESPGVRLRYAEALEYLGRTAEAEAERRRAHELSSSGDALVARLAGEGRLAASKGDHETAAARYREALENAPDRHDVRMALAGTLAARGRYDAALAEYQRILRAEPDHANARRSQVAALLLSGRYGPARVEVNEALRRSPRDLGLAMTQARLLAAAPEARVRDGALALEVARRIQTVDQGLLARDTLALALAAAGQAAEAARVQQEVVDAAASADAAVPDEIRGDMSDRLATYRAGRAWQASDPRQLLALGGPGG